MAKRLMILVGTLAVLLASTVPALAQEEANQGEAADTLPPVPPGYERVVWTFELIVEGDLPEDVAFFGRTIAPAGTDGGTSDVPLTDPDGDGVYTGSDFGYLVPGLDVPNLVNAPPTLQIVQNAGPKARVIKDFGVVPLDEDKTFSASVSFPENGGSGSGNSGSSGSGKSNAAGGSSSGGSSSGSGSEAKSGGAKAKELPKTGGDTLPALGLVGALLVGSGFLIRRAAR